MQLSDDLIQIEFLRGGLQLFITDSCLPVECLGQVGSFKEDLLETLHLADVL